MRTFSVTMSADAWALVYRLMLRELRKPTTKQDGEHIEDPADRHLFLKCLEHEAQERDTALHWIAPIIEHAAGNKRLAYLRNSLGRPLTDDERAVAASYASEDTTGAFPYV